VSLILWAIIVCVFLCVLIALIRLRIKDSKKRYNNALLIFYLAVALWISAGIGGIFTQVHSNISQIQNKAQPLGVSKRPSRNRPSSSPNDHYDLILWGLIVLGGVYVIRRPEWAGMLVDGLAAWKGKDLDRSREMLIQHAISNPKDREWVQKFLVDIETKRTEKEPEEPEIMPLDVIPK
tara:strand:- start:542 stop:1078 length:537 start_codon:yes stop_codon:yes gene_type:complete